MSAVLRGDVIEPFQKAQERETQKRNGQEGLSHLLVAKLPVSRQTRS